MKIFPHLFLLLLLPGPLQAARPATNMPETGSRPRERRQSASVCAGERHGTPVRQIPQREGITVAFYNVESLCDTLSTTGGGDADYTPEGRYRWNTQRYREKIGRIARVLDDLNADVTALCEVENEAVVRDLMFAMERSYNYIHRESGGPRGMDAVLLYRGDTFFPETVRQAGGRGLPRRVLIVTGRLLGQPVTFVVCHMPSLLNGASYRREGARSLRRIMDELVLRDPQRPVILLGDFNAPPDSRTARREAGIGQTDEKGGIAAASGPGTVPKLYTPFAALSRRGYGSYVYRDKRLLYDYICLTPQLLPGGNAAFCFRGRYGIFVREYMVRREGSRAGYPWRTIENGRYAGGYSDHFPVWLKLEKQVPK